MNQLSEKMTLYYRCLLETLGENHLLRRTVFAIDRGDSAAGELDDPLDEDAHSPVPGIVHRYPDRVLFLSTLNCAVHCRYCTRARLTGSGDAPEWAPMFDYIEAHTEIRDVLVSGGDPLTLSDARLEELLVRLRKIEHVRIIRIGSKVPAVLPERVTPELAALLSRHCIWLSLHFTHPAELTEAVRTACARLAEAGVPMVSQTVLLRDINDDIETLTELFYGLLECRVKPYYLFHCDAVSGSAPFRVSLERGCALIRELEKTVSGLAVPHFATDGPEGKTRQGFQRFSV